MLNSPPFGPKARYVSFPIVTKARQRVLPYLMKMDRQEGDDDVMEDGPPGR